MIWKVGPNERGYTVDIVPTSIQSLLTFTGQMKFINWSDRFHTNESSGNNEIVFSEYESTSHHL